MLTSDEEIPVLFQSLAVFADHVIQTQVQLIKGEGLLCVCSSFSGRIVVSFLQHQKKCQRTRRRLFGSITAQD